MPTHVDWTVRRASDTDAVILAPLVRALAVEEGYGRPPDLQKLSPLIATLINEGASDFFLATLPDQAVGCLQLNYRRSTWSTARYGYIEDFYLLPHARSQGIGTALIEAACTHARAVACAYVDLDVRAENSAAQRLYTRLGFARGTSEIWRRPLVARN